MDMYVADEKTIKTQFWLKKRVTCKHKAWFQFDTHHYMQNACKKVAMYFVSGKFRKKCKGHGKSYTLVTKY